MHTDTAGQPVIQPEPRPPRHRKWPRRVAIGAAFAVTLGIGIGIGAATQNTGISQATYNTSQAHVSSLTGQVSTLNGQVSTLNGQVSTLQGQLTTAQGQAQHATAIAQAKATSDYAARNAALSQTYQSKEAALAATQQTANQEAATLKQELGQVQANSISADGVYVVGQDIKSGTWHTNGDNGVGGSACYFATLNDNSGNINSIANNNNFDGPETVDVSGLYALQISGPCTWNLVP